MDEDLIKRVEMLEKQVEELKAYLSSLVAIDYGDAESDITCLIEEGIEEFRLGSIGDTDKLLQHDLVFDDLGGRLDEIEQRLDDLEIPE